MVLTTGKSDIERTKEITWRSLHTGRMSFLSPERFRLIMVLILALGVRLVNIQSPLLEYHSWRQTTTAMMARDLIHNGYNLFYPQVDYFGPQAASLESEFPLYPFIVSLLYGAFGVQEWLARLVAILFAVGSTWLLYSLVKRYLGPGPAFFAGVFFSLSPFSIFFGRAVMPESAMLCLSIAAIWAFSKWTDTNRMSFYWLSMVLAVLASAVKLPSLYIVLPVGALFLNTAQGRGKSAIASLVDWRIWLWGCIAVATPFLWYIHAAQIGAETGASLGLLSSGGGDRLGTLGMWLNPDFYSVFGSWFVADIATWGAVPVFLLGLLWLPRKRDELVLYGWLLAIVIYVFGVANGMVAQEYYILPVAPVMAIFAGKGASRLLSLAVHRYKLLLVLVTPFLIVSLASAAFFSYERLAPLYQTTDVFMDAAQATAEVTTTGTPIIAVHYGEPEILYYSDRKGWHLFPNDLSLSKVEELRRKGAKALVLAEQAGLAGKEETADILRRYPVIGVADSSIVVSLDPEREVRYEESQVNKSFGNLIELQAANVDKRVVPGGDNILVSLKLLAQEKIEDDLRISLRLIGENGYLGGQVDSVPANGYFPTNSWVSGQVLNDLYSLPVLDGAIPGQYNLELRIYRKTDLTPLSVDGENMAVVNLGTVSVLPSFKATVPTSWTGINKEVGNDLQLLAFEAPSGPYRPGDYVHVSSLWQAKTANPSGYKAVFRLSSASGQSLPEDVEEISSTYPTELWENGQVLHLESLVRIPAKADTGDYTLSLGMIRNTEPIVFSGGQWPFVQKNQRLDVQKIAVQGRERRFDVPDSMISQDIALGESIKLLGYRFEGNSAGEWQTGDKIRLILVWQALAETDKSYTVFVHLLGGGTKVVAQVDSVPQAGAAPTLGWAEGEVITDSYDIMIPSDLAPGNYEFEVGMYDPRSGERLGTQQGDDRILLNPVEVLAK